MPSEREERDARIHALRDKARADVQAALTCCDSSIGDGRSEEMRSHLDVLRNALAQRNQDRQTIEKIRDALEEIFCTEGEDAGVIYLSSDSPTYSDPHTGVENYYYEHFSELGDALVKLYRMLPPAPQAPKDAR